MSVIFRVTCCVKGGGDDNNDSVNEASLVTEFFQYKCCSCGKQGHQAYTIPEKKSKKSFGGECNYCGENGHNNAAGCWGKPEN